MPIRKGPPDRYALEDHHPLRGHPGIDSRLASLSTSDRAVGRLAMLVAIASYRVPDSAVAEVRAGGHDDAELIGLTAWAALAAARHRGNVLATAHEASGSAP